MMDICELFRTSVVRPGRGAASPLRSCLHYFLNLYQRLVSLFNKLLQLISSPHLLAERAGTQMEMLAEHPTKVVRVGEAGRLRDCGDGLVGVQ